ncbi:DUF3800 domain-containing protein [[Clostridium] symbiosum]|uniref:DUF3800 domain-containing protein n=1 Tax=Clostridium symbiosum TaxID=1512 RepID=UPI001A9BB383|nr:DUF3800 domain-containing protein [[Clostridium] symbiosum]
MIYNFYCDESCHLPNDGNKIMVLGGIWCPKSQVRKINEDIRAIKKKYSIGSEMKWVKVSEAKKEAYLELINYFFDLEDLHFRVLVVDNKNAINHERYNQTHDEWYYKMYFNMIKTILSPKDKYNIYLDIKDTRSKTKIRKLTEVLSNNMYDFSHQTITNMQVIRSHEVEIMQIVDILIGAIAYVSRGLNSVNAKNEIISLIKERSGYSLVRNTPPREDKFNVFHLQLSEGGSLDVC